VVASLAKDFQKLATLLLRALASSLRMYMLQFYLYLGIHSFFQLILFLLLFLFIKNYFINLLPIVFVPSFYFNYYRCKFRALQISHYTELDLVFPSVLLIIHCRKMMFQTEGVDIHFATCQYFYAE